MSTSSTFSPLAIAVVIVTGFATTGVNAAAQANARRQPDLTGEWQLNSDLSEDPQEKLQSMRAGGEHAGREHAGGAQADRAGHGAGRHEIEAQRETHTQLAELILSAPARFVLTQDGDQVILTEPDGRVRTLRTNNRKMKFEGRDVKTRWDKNRVVSEITRGNAKVIETYELSPASHQLILTSTMDIRGQRVSVRRVYDPVSE